MTRLLRGTLSRAQEMLMLLLQQVTGSDRVDSPAGARVQPDNSYSPRVINLITDLSDLEIKLPMHMWLHCSSALLTCSLLTRFQTAKNDPFLSSLSLAFQRD